VTLGLLAPMVSLFLIFMTRALQQQLRDLEQQIREEREWRRQSRQREAEITCEVTNPTRFRQDRPHNISGSGRRWTVRQQDHFW
jgi:hypothetical protein